MTTYYNENDPKAAAWLRELIKGDHIAAGDVDERSIKDVVPNDLSGYNQCHFFAGIGGWSYALRLAGWPDDKPVWTGSCPCQPFSTAGKGKGFADERHLWPAWFHLISECKPSIVFGEQVANTLPWLDLVSSDLEAKDYTVGAAIVGAHSVGAPHIRQRLYWVAYGTQRGWSEECSDIGRFVARNGAQGWAAGLESSRDAGELGNANNSGSQGRRVPDGECSYQWPLGATSDFVQCRDGKRRPVEPGVFPLAHGVSGRVGLLRGYGNAIVPQVAAAFIQAARL